MVGQPHLSGTIVSNYPQLVNIDLMSFSHRVTSFKRCFSFSNSEQLVSMSLELTAIVDGTYNLDSFTVDQIEAARRPIDLLKVGFEYGNCEEHQIVGDVEWLEIEYT